MKKNSLMKILAAIMVAATLLTVGFALTAQAAAPKGTMSYAYGEDKPKKLVSAIQYSTKTENSMNMTGVVHYIAGANSPNTINYVGTKQYNVAAIEGNINAGVSKGESYFNHYVDGSLTKSSSWRSYNFM